MTLEDIYEYALTWHGTPYQYGGEGFGHRNDYGIDCSGYLKKIAVFGGFKFERDMCAHDLYLMVKDQPPVKQLGAWAFFGTLNRVTHCGFMCDHRVMISAAGGNERITTIVSAKEMNAKVQLQPLRIYKTPAFVGAFMPKYPFLSSEALSSALNVGAGTPG